MIFYLLDIIIIAVCIGICIGLSFLKVYLLQINLINSAFLGSFGGIFLYCIGRYGDELGIKLPFEFVVHPAICIAAGIALFFLTILIQRTKVGFWIFAVFFSVVWGLALAGIVYFFTKDMIWFWVVLGIACISNFSAHLRSRKLKVDLTAPYTHSN